MCSMEYESPTTHLNRDYPRFIWIGSSVNKHFLYNVIGKAAFTTPGLRVHPVKHTQCNASTFYCCDQRSGLVCCWRVHSPHLALPWGMDQRAKRNQISMWKAENLGTCSLAETQLLGEK